MLNIIDESMQTVNLQYNVPVGYSIDEFVSKINSYVARLTKKSISVNDGKDLNKETEEALQEAHAHIQAYKKGESLAETGSIDTSSVQAMLKSCGL